MNLLKGLVLAVAFTMMATPARAAIIYTDLTTAAPPGSLGSYTMTAFPDDPRAESSTVNDVVSPLGGTVDFSAGMRLLNVGSTWATWSHGYSGDIYYTGGATSATLTLPAGTSAFYLYVEPQPFQFFDIQVCSELVCATQSVTGSAGARGWGFHEDSGGAISSISITALTDFAIGEFGIAGAVAVPEPATLALLGLGAVGLIARRRRS